MVKKKDQTPCHAQKNKKQLTVYIPTHERPKLLNNALHHIKNVFDAGIDLELRIYDSSGDERSYEVVEEFKKTNNTFPIYYKRKNYQHVLWKMVEACRDAEGQYITYLGDDDYFNIDHLKDALKKLKHQPQIHGWFATWQIWDDEKKEIVCKTNDQGLNWITSESRTYGMEDVVLLANEVVNRVVCPEIFILKTETARKIMIDWRYPDEQMALFVLLRTLRFGKIHLTNTPFYRYCEVRQKAFLEDDEQTQTHYGERLYKEAPFMTRFSREWFVSQAFREAGHDSIPEETQKAILQAINYEYIQRLKGNGITAAIRHQEYQIAHRYISNMASWNQDILSKEDLYQFEKGYLIAYALQTIEKQIEHIEEKKELNVLGFAENDVSQYFKNEKRNSSIKTYLTQNYEDVLNDAPILVPLAKQRKKLIEKHSFKENKIIAFEDVMNTLRMIREHISCDEFVSKECQI